MGRAGGSGGSALCEGISGQSFLAYRLFVVASFSVFKVVNRCKSE